MAVKFRSSGNFSLNIYWSPETRPADEPATINPPLRELPPGPWRSSGGYLDYSDWPERERFAELDRAIETGLGDSPAVDAEVGPLRRCRAKIADSANCNAYFSVGADYNGWKCEAHRVSVSGEKPGNLWRENLLMIFEHGLDAARWGARRNR